MSEAHSLNAAAAHAPRPPASATIWHWQSDFEGEAPQVGMSPRIKGTIQATIAASVAGFFLFNDHLLASKIVGGIATFILLAALLSPHGLFAALERGVARLAALVGSGVSWILLPLVFFGFFAPYGILFRRGKHDPLKRFKEPEAETYWVVRPPDTDPNRRRHQY